MTIAKTRKDSSWQTDSKSKITDIHYTAYYTSNLLAPVCPNQVERRHNSLLSACTTYMCSFTD